MLNATLDEEDKKKNVGSMLTDINVESEWKKTLYVCVCMNERKSFYTDEWTKMLLQLASCLVMIIIWTVIDQIREENCV